MPSSLIKSFAEKSGKSVPAVGKIWDEVKKSVKDIYDYKEGTPRFYQAVTGILKKRLQLDEISEEEIKMLDESIADLSDLTSTGDDKKLVSLFKEFGDTEAFYEKAEDIAFAYFEDPDDAYSALQRWVYDAKKKSKKMPFEESEDFNLEIENGDLVDFGTNLGKLYVVNKKYSPAKYWVTDDKHDRFNKDAQGWSVGKDLAIRIIEQGKEGVAESAKEDLTEATISTDIAAKPERMGTVQKRVEPDDYINGLPIFEVDSKDFMGASKIRHNGMRYNIKNEKVNAYLRENGYRKSFGIRWNGNSMRIK